MEQVRLLTMLLSCVAAATLLMGCDPPESAPPPPESNAGTDVSAPAPLTAENPADAVAAGEVGATRFHARGNEPFWSVTVDGQSLVYSTPDLQPGVHLVATRTDNPTGVQFNGRDGDGDGDFVLIITPGHCQDSMSGHMFDYTATFSYRDQRYTGCASGEG